MLAFCIVGGPVKVRREEWITQDGLMGGSGATMLPSAAMREAGEMRAKDAHRKHIEFELPAQMPPLPPPTSSTPEPVERKAVP